MLPLPKYAPYLAHCEWFTTARRARALVSGKKDPALALQLMFWSTVPPAPKPVPSPLEEPRAEQSVVAVPEEIAVAANDGAEQPDNECFEPDDTGKADDVIDRFLEHGEYKIVVPAGDDRTTEQVAMEIDIDPAIASRELAEIYRSQGLNDKADEIYRLLDNND